MHPLYPLYLMVAWYEGWKRDSADKKAPGNKQVAYREAIRAINRRSSIGEKVVERRRAWLEPLEARGLARRIFLRARTDVVVHMAAAGPLELGLALSHVYGFPILPATSLKGLSRCVRESEEERGRLYGTQKARGSVVVLDGLPLEYTVGLDVMTPHFSGWYQNQRDLPNDTENPVPIPFVSVKQGSTFETALVVSGRERQADLDAVVRDIVKGLEECGFGAKTAAGYGVFQVDMAPRVEKRDIEGEGDGVASEARGSQRSDFERQLARIEALPGGGAAAGQMAPYVDWCLALGDEGQRQQAAGAIVRKMTYRWVKRKARDKETWKRILELASKGE